MLMRLVDAREGREATCYWERLVTKEPSWLNETFTHAGPTTNTHCGRLVEYMQDCKTRTHCQLQPDTTSSGKESKYNTLLQITFGHLSKTHTHTSTQRCGAGGVTVSDSSIFHLMELQ